jgi:hypothetical protein
VSSLSCANLQEFGNLTLKSYLFIGWVLLCSSLISSVTTLEFRELLAKELVCSPEATCTEACSLHDKITHVREKDSEKEKVVHFPLYTSCMNMDVLSRKRKGVYDMNLVEKHVVLLMKGGEWQNNVAVYLRDYVRSILLLVLSVLILQKEGGSFCSFPTIGASSSWYRRERTG